MHNSFQYSGVEMGSSIQTVAPETRATPTTIEAAHESSDLLASSRGPAIELCIDPINYHTGVANTIQRAELVGTFKALQVDHSGSNLMICTNSLASMSHIYMIDMHMRCFSLHKECKHEELLSLTVVELAKRQERVSMYSFSR